MAKFYGLKIRSGVIILDKVGNKWRADVEKWLSEN